MAELMRWDPMREVMTLREAMDRLFEESFVWPFREWFGTGDGRTQLYLPMDMYETDDAIIVKAVVPGVRPDDVEIQVSGDVLTIRGEVKDEFEGKRGTYHLRERRHGTFQRSLSLPVPINADKAEALFENGVLTLTLPKVEEVKPKQIKVKAK